MKARDVNVEPVAVEPTDQLHHLPLGSADSKLVSRKAIGYRHLGHSGSMSKARCHLRAHA